MNKTLYISIDTTLDYTVECPKLVKRGDILKLQIKVFTDGVLRNLTGQNIDIILQKADGTLIENTIDIANVSNGVVTANLDVQATVVAGLVSGELQLSDEEGQESTNTFTFEVNSSLADGVIEVSKDDINTLNQLRDLIATGETTIAEYETHILAIANSIEAIEALENIKSYIDTNLAALQQENAEAVVNIPALKTENDKAPALTSNLEIQNDEATANIGTLTTKNAEAITNENNLDDSISLAQTTKIALDTSKDDADASKITLDSSVSDANASKLALDTSKTNADASKIAIDLSVQEANDFVAAHGDIIELDNRMDLAELQLSDVENKQFNDGVSIWKWYDAVLNKGLSNEDWSVAMQNALDYCYSNKLTLFFPTYTKYQLYSTINLDYNADFKGMQKNRGGQNSEVKITCYADPVFQSKYPISNKVPNSSWIMMEGLCFISGLSTTSHILFNKICLTSSRIYKNYFSGFGTWLKGNLRGINRIHDNVIAVKEHVIDSLEDNDSTYNNTTNADLYDGYIIDNYFIGDTSTCNTIFFQTRGLSLMTIENNFMEYGECGIVANKGDSCNIKGNVFDFIIQGINLGDNIGCNIESNIFHFGDSSFSTHPNWTNTIARTKFASGNFMNIVGTKLKNCIITNNQSVSSAKFLVLNGSRNDYTDVKIANNIKYGDAYGGAVIGSANKYVLAFVQISGGSSSHEPPSGIYIDDEALKDYSLLPLPTLVDGGNVGICPTYNGHTFRQADRIVTTKHGVFYDQDGKVIFSSVVAGRTKKTVELRYLPSYGLPNDVLNADGTITRNVAHATLNGSETWQQVNPSTSTNTVMFQYNPSNGFVGAADNVENIISDYFQPRINGQLYSSSYDSEGIAYDHTGAIQIKVNKNRLSTIDAAGFKTWLGVNNIEVSYRINTPTTENS